AVAQAGRRRAVGEDVAQMAVAAGTAHLGADHAVGAVLVLGHGVLGDRLGERRPAGARLELLARLEQRIAATRTNVGPRLLRPKKAALPGRLRPVLPQNAILLRRKAPSPFLVAEVQLIDHDLLLSRHRQPRSLPLPRFADLRLELAA